MKQFTCEEDEKKEREENNKETIKGNKKYFEITWMVIFPLNFTTTMLKTKKICHARENWLDLVNSCIYHARQTCEI